MLSQGEGPCREDVRGGGCQRTRQRYDKSPTSKIYTTWAHILSDRAVFCTSRGEGKMAGFNAPGAFYPAVRAGSSNTRFFFFGGHLPQTYARSKQYLPEIFVRLAFIR